MTSPLLAILWMTFVFVVLIPVSTIAAKALLALRRHFVEPASVDEGSDLTYLLIVSPVLAPVVWFVSETVHVSEAYLGSVANVESFCFDLVIASTLLLGALGWLLARHGREERERGGRPHAGTTTRLRQVCDSHAALSQCANRIHGVEGGEHDSATRGFFRPVVEVDAAFAAGLSDSALAGVLLHEVEHLRTFDPFRNLVGHTCLALNPLGRWLAADWRRWRAGRELRCDTAALRANADPLSLAEALLCAARPPRGAVVAAPLTGAHAGFLKLRVQRLLAPITVRPEPLFVTALPPTLLTLEVVLPHFLASAPIQQIHQLACHPFLALLLA